MDRNAAGNKAGAESFKSLSARRAWIEIRALQNTRMDVLTSLSARRAWIEMGVYKRHNLEGLVALRKESVDRNLDNGIALIPHQQSLSARRAWIEMSACWRAVCSAVSRSPQGERG